ncbi:hypothetical protein [Oscillibacter sp.]|uniref:hypothetical protein n=1 Tax=Oscillibacter sp. TaxID=1945593 RepID=UPI0028963D09|nr:hypothetical protein [Oscillibacter sp.]
MAKNKKKCAIPQYELEALAEVLYPSLIAFYDSPAQFKAWREQQEAQAVKKTT